MSLNQSKENNLPSYQYPPVIEVVCGITFKNIEQFKAVHLGLFWQRVRDDYPICQQAFPLGFPPLPSGTDAKFELPLPRLWFINEKENGLIQLQNNRFLYNWRKIKPEELYPRYQTVIGFFKNNFNIFNNFLQEENLGSLDPIECELTYVNHILKGEGWESVSDINDVLTELNWRMNKERFLPEPSKLGWQATFALPEDKGRLNAKLEQTKRIFDKRPVLTLELAARGLGADKSAEAIWNWFELAHEWIVCGFTDLTATKIQTDFWKREDNIKDV